MNFPFNNCMILQHITGFLEKQNNLIVDTADKLFHMTKENLVHARLPHFHIPAAVETLTTGLFQALVVRFIL